MLFGVGVPVSIKAKSYWPAVTAALVGTMVDFAYGYNVACAQHVTDYRRAAEAAPPRFGLAGVYGKEKEAIEFKDSRPPTMPPMPHQPAPPFSSPTTTASGSPPGPTR